MKNAKKSLIRQRPRLLYAGIHSQGVGWLTDPQTTENTELIYIGKGSGKAEIGEETYPFAAGDLIVCNKGCRHREFFDDVP